MDTEVTSDAGLPKMYHKDDNCSNCGTPPKAATGKHRCCKRCRTVVYCDKACQKSHWKQHKPLCLWQQEQHAILMERGAEGAASTLAAKDLDDFVHAHNHSFHQAAYAAICDFQSDDKVDDFDFDAYHIHYQLQARDDHDSDPTRFFHIMTGAIRPREMLFASSPTQPRDLFANNLVEFDKKHRAIPGKPCIGTVPCHFEVVDIDQHLMSAIMLTKDSFLNAVREKNIWTVPEPRHDLWFSQLQQKVLLGHVFKPMEGYEGWVSDIGKMVKKREKWTWLSLTWEEVATYGYHPTLSGLVY